MVIQKRMITFKYLEFENMVIVFVSSAAAIYEHNGLSITTEGVMQWIFTVFLRIENTEISCG